jgi:ABC-2 type transport system ATP-binding protein
VGTILKVDGLTKWFGSTMAIENLTFDVKQGQVVGLLGPNGSGKTTTLSIILRIKYATKGTFYWTSGNGLVMGNKNIGSLIEVPYFYPYLSLEKNLKIVAQVKSADYKEVGKVLKTVGLDKRAQSNYFTLSLGMKQRLGLASALLGNPDVLVLDEPTNGLDPEGIAEVRNIIIEQSKIGKTIILASHILDEVEKVCSHVIILKNGKSISSGSVKELLSEKKLVSISAEDINMLMANLNKINGVDVIESKGEKVLISLDETLTSAAVNCKLVEMGTPPSTITVHKKTLESQFLELVKK